MKIEFKLTYDDNGCANTPLDILESVWEVHYRCISAHTWPDIALCTSAVYRASQALVMELIALAFPGYDANRIYEMATDAGEINAEGFRESLDYEMRQAKWEEFQRGWRLRDDLRYALEGNAEIIKAMRDWCRETGWTMAGSYFISPEVAIQTVEKHYDGGGVLGFLSDNDLIP
jgi:hypothetical protein